jgi:DNA repair protein RecN (Recombination protein N)
MLRHLHIRDFAIVEDLELDLGAGMTVLSGETGAGKSILLDALGLTLGDRADSAAVRHGAQRAEITASFDVTKLPGVLAWLRERELDAGEECLIRRTVGTDGRSRGYINGQPMPIQALRELGEQLVDIHGQHAHQSLLRRGVQRQILDAYAGHGRLLEEVGETYRRWCALREERERLAASDEERNARRELLGYQVEELRTLDLGATEPNELDEEQRRLANANRLIEGCQRTVEALYEGEEGTVSGLLSRTMSELGELERFDEALRGPGEMLQSAAIQIEEAAGELRHHLADLELDPERLAWVEQRLTAVYDLARKHQTTPEDLPDLLHRLEEELARIEDSGARLAATEEELAAAAEQYRALASELSGGRRKGAARLAAEVTANVRELGMPDGQFEVRIEPLGSDEFSAHGADRVEYLITANPGQPSSPLSKVASGGELSRISLALEVIVAGSASIPTLIFDEVDVGVGGGVAEMVGRRLRALSESVQVLCVTHQPQVAALAHQHLRVAKHTNTKRTRATIQPLADAARVEEIARMLGGMEITEQTLSHASEMMALGQAPAKTRRRKA